MATAVYSTASLKESNAQPYKSMTGKLNASLLRSLEVMGFEYMTPVQNKVLTELPSFKSDCLVQAKTGTGKTIAFLLPTLHSLLADGTLPKGQVGILIMSPTRELALQIAKECDELTTQLPKRLECHTAFGGTTRATNLNKFMRGDPSILVATPGRLKDYLSELPTRRKLANIRAVILDEADTMLEKGFLQDVSEILKLLPRKDTGWQGMCFSATVPPKVREVVNIVLKPGYTSISTIDKSEPPTVARVPQYHVIIPSLTTMLTALMALLKRECASSSKIIVFGATANMVAMFAKIYEQETPFKVYQLQSRLSQSTRTRTTEDFKAAKDGILFASDVIGRGMDFPNVDLVIQVGLPSNGEQYVHRVGRTARAGNDGRAIIMLTQGESFFLTQNRQLPIQPHPEADGIIKESGSFSAQIEQKMYTIDEATKSKAYSSLLGFFAGSGFLKPLRLDKAGLVVMTNEFATKAMHCPEPPAMERSTVGKMGLKGVPGIRFALPGDNPARPSRAPGKRPHDNNAESIRQGLGQVKRPEHLRPPRQPQSGIKKESQEPGSRRTRHQGPPRLSNSDESWGTDQRQTRQQEGRRRQPQV